MSDSDDTRRWGGPDIGGVRQTDTNMNRMYYESNMRSAQEQERLGNHENARLCRETAQQFLNGTHWSIPGNH